jgi:hypothetical protein
MFTDNVSELTVGPIFTGHMKKNNQMSRLLPYIQGGSNICVYTSHSLSRSYLNHLVYVEWAVG